MARLTDDENVAHRKERDALRALLASAGWPYLLGHVATVKQARIEGLAAIGGKPEDTRQHVYGYHDAVALPQWPEARLEFLEKEIARHTDGK